MGEFRRGAETADVVARARVLFIMPYSAAGSAVLKAGKGSPDLYQFIPLGVPILAALTPEERFDVRFINEYVDRVDPLPLDVDLVALSFLTPSANRAYEIGDWYRAHGIPVVMGGIHVSAVPEEAQKHADAVAVGEGEEIWPAMLADFEAGRLKPRYDAPRPVPMELVPTPDWSVVANWKERRMTSVQTTRGCVYDCDFCDIFEFFGRKMRHRPVEHVVDEIRTFLAVKAPNARYVVFKDDNITADRRYARELFEALKPLNIQWVAQGSLKTFTDELVQLAAESGCVLMLVGFESISDEKIREYRKSLTDFELLEQRIDCFHRHNIAVWGTFIFGHDQDDAGVFERTCRYGDELGIDYMGYNILTPFPGTRLYERLRDEGRLVTDDWSHYDLEHVVFRPKQMSAEELLAGYAWAYQHSFSVRSIVRRMGAILMRRLRAGRKIPVRYFLFFHLVFRRVARSYAKSPERARPMRAT